MAAASATAQRAARFGARVGAVGGVLFAVAASAIFASATLGSSLPPIPGPANLSRVARIEWNFEGLLDRTFGTDGFAVKHGVFVDAQTAGCDLALCQEYQPIFAPHTATAFHLVAVAPAGTFGNYPVLVRVQTDYVACDATNTTWLIRFTDSVNFALDCQRPQKA